MTYEHTRKNYAHGIAARAMHERHRQLIGASCEAIAVEYEDLNDSLGQTLECVTAFEFPDGSRLVRAEGKNLWQEGAWSADDEGEESCD